MDEKLKLKSVTADAKALIRECPGYIIEIYKFYLPYWDYIIVEEIKGILALYKFPNKKKSIENIRYYYPLITKFNLSFIPKLLIEIPNMHRLAAEMEPIAFAVDAHFRLKHGQDFFVVLHKHFRGIRAWYIALNIYGYYRQAIDKEFSGKEIAKIIIGLREKYVNFEKLENKVRQKIKIVYSDILLADADLYYVTKKAIGELLKKSAKDAPKLSDDPFIKQFIWNETQLLWGKLIDPFSHKAQQLSDALAREYRIVTTKAKNRWESLHGFEYDGHIEKTLPNGEIIRKPKIIQKDALRHVSRLSECDEPLEKFDGCKYREVENYKRDFARRDLFERIKTDPRTPLRVKKLAEARLKHPEKTISEQCLELRIGETTFRKDMGILRDAIARLNNGIDIKEFYS